jgi:demethylmenaquinone methyltransferase/2-methoxy-6-polyprenyl-1,4-benzoquinol methylase
MATEKEHSGRSISPDYWDRISDRYDRQLWLESRSVRCLLELASPTAHTRVLDLATGTGAILRALAARPSPPHHVVGVDRSEAMLAHVPPFPDGWSKVQADARDLPFADCSFDLVTASYLLHLLDETDRSAVLNEAHRVLQPKGLIAVLTPAIPPGGPLRPIAWALNQLAARVPERFGGLRALDPTQPLSEAGFETLSTRQTAHGYIAMSTLARKSNAQGPRER